MKPGTGRRQVEAEAARHAERRLHAQRGGGERLVGGRGRQDDRVHLGRRRTGIGQRGARASVPMKAAVSCGPAIWRWRMPVRSADPLSEVSSVRASSSLVTTRSGR
jgi:hypothetical protein